MTTEDTNLIEQRACHECERLRELLRAHMEPRVCEEGEMCGQCAECALLSAQAEVQREADRADKAERKCAEALKALETWYQMPNPTPAQIDIAMEALKP